MKLAVCPISEVRYVPLTAKNAIMRGVILRVALAHTAYARNAPSARAALPGSFSPPVLRIAPARTTGRRQERAV